MRFFRRRPSTRGQKGQAMTETVLMFPIFMFFMFAFAKLFALMVLVQKVEIASFYAARRWQLESHRNYQYSGFDTGQLRGDIERRVSDYLGYGSPSEKFLDLMPTPNSTCSGADFECEPTQVWNVCTLKVQTRPIDIAWMYHSPGYTLEVTKYVPSRDRPIAFVLPGLQN